MFASRLFRLLPALLLAASLAWSSGARALCAGDCNEDRRVEIAELIKGVAIALDSLPASRCPAIDTNGSNSVSIGELIAAVASALSGCPADTPPPPPTATPTIGIEPIFPANYRDTFVEVRNCRFSVEHDFRSIRVLTNPIAAEPYRRNQNPLPEGSIVVKEEFDAADCSNDTDLVAWRVMRKEAAGFDPQDADWHWQWVDAPGRGVQLDDKTTCIGCHRRDECMARDYMCTEEGDTRGKLQPVLEDLPAALLSVAGTGPTDVYAVGADPGDGRGPLVLRYDGAEWRRLETGTTGDDLWWISVTPIGSDFFLAGERGLILQYDPPSGDFTHHTTPGTEHLYGIWGAAANDIWAVGGFDEDPDMSGAIWHYDGNTWSRQDLSGVCELGVPLLFKVWGRTANDVYAVGARGAVLHYDGNTWSAVACRGGRSLFTVHGSETDTVAVGGFSDGGGVVLERQVNGSFANRTPAGVDQLNGVFLSPDGRGVAVGYSLATAVRDAGAWRVADEGDDDQARDFHAVWVDGEDGIWAVGGDLSIDLIKGIVSYGGPRQVSGTLR